MNEPYDVPIELVKVYGRLVRAYTLIKEKDEKVELQELSDILRDIDKYNILIGTEIWKKDDMINETELDHLERICKHQLNVAQTELKNLKNK